MTNKKLGVKRECPNCSAKFYDLKKKPAACPKCEHSFEPVKAAKVKKERTEQPKKTQEAPVVSQTPEAPPETAVTFEEADAEMATASSSRNAGLDNEDENSEEDNFIPANDDDDNDALLAANDEEDEDVRVMIDDNITSDT